MKPIRTWILIADGARARVLENLGPGKGLRKIGRELKAPPNPPTRDQFTDRAGRVMERADVARHAMEPKTDPHRAQKSAFARNLAERINTAARKGHFERLVLVAPPTSLGDLREALDEHASAKVTASLPKDLTNTPDSKIPQHLKEFMPL